MVLVGVLEEKGRPAVGEIQAQVAFRGVEVGGRVRQGEPTGGRGWGVPVWRSHAESCRLGGGGSRGREGPPVPSQVLGMIFPLAVTLRLGLPSPYSVHPVPSTAWLGWGLWGTGSFGAAPVSMGAGGHMGQRVGMGTHGSVRGKGQPAMMQCLSSPRDTATNHLSPNPAPNMLGPPKTPGLPMSLLFWEPQIIPTCPVQGGIVTPGAG